jgi:hypothetical protein
VLEEELSKADQLGNGGIKVRDALLGDADKPLAPA